MSNSLPSKAIATAPRGRTAQIVSTRSMPAKVSITPAARVTNARSASSAWSTILRLGETCRSPRTRRMSSTNVCMRANSASAFSSRKLDEITGHAAVVHKSLLGNSSPATCVLRIACTLSHSVSVTKGHTGCNKRTIASSVAARIACCVALLRMVGFTPSRYQSQKSRHTKS